MVLKNLFSKSKFLLDFVSMLGSNVVLLLIGLFTSIVTTRVLGPSGMGTFTILTTFSLLFVSLAEMGIKQSTIYYSAKGIDLSRILSANSILWFFASLLGIFLFYFIIVSKKIDIDADLIWLAALIVPITMSNNLLNGVMIGADKISKNAGLNIINGGVRLAVVVLFLLVFELYVLGALLALLVPSITIVIRKFHFLRSKLNIKWELRFDLQLIKKLVTHGLLYGLALFLMTNQKQIPIFVMSGVLPPKDIGIYGVGLTFANLVYQLFNALGPVVFVKSAKSKDPVESSLKIQKLMRVMFLVLILSSFFIFIAIEFILPLMYGQRFIESIPITQIMLVGIIFYNIFLVLNMDLAGKGKPWFAIYTLVPVSVLNYVLNFFMVHKFGNIGAAISTSVSMAIAAIIFVLLYSKEVKMPLTSILIPRKTDWDFITNLIQRNRRKNDEN